MTSILMSRVKLLYRSLYIFENKHHFQLHKMVSDIGQTQVETNFVRHFRCKLSELHLSKFAM